MKIIGVVIFNSAFRTEELENHKLIKTIKLNVEIAGESFTEKTIEELSTRVEEVKEIPKTSQPSTGIVIQAYEEALKEFDDIVVLTPDKHLSGTHQNAVLAKSMLESKQENVHIIETKSFALSEAYMCKTALELIEEQKPIEEIVTTLEAIPDKFQTYIVPGNFEYLKMSGRVNVAQLIVGKIMTLKLLIKHKDGKADVYKKGRGFKKILKEIQKEVESNSNIKEIYVGHMDPEPKELALLEEVLKKNHKITTTKYASVILAAHFGPKTVGFLVVKN